MFEAGAGWEHNTPLSLSAGVFSAAPRKGPREQAVTPAQRRLFAATTKCLEVSRRAVGSREPRSGPAARLSSTPQPPSRALGAWQALPWHRGAWEVLTEEPGPVSAPGSPRTPGPGLVSSATEMDASISLAAHVPCPGGRGRSGCCSHSILLPAEVSPHPAAPRCAGQGFSQDHVRRQPREAKQTDAEARLHEAHSDQWAGRGEAGWIRARR